MRFPVLVLAVCLLGCSEAAPEPPVVEEIEPAPPAPVRYAIHEWGLLDIDLGDGSAEWAAGPGRLDSATTPTPTPTTPMTPTPTTVMRPHMRPSVGRRKPVLYFHLLSDTVPEGFALDVSVNLGVGEMLEHFPAGTLSEHGIGWSGISLASESCSGGPYPTEESEECASVSDGYCEVAELANYVSDDVGCITVAGREQNFLFYRGGGAAPDLPVSIVRDDEGTVRITNDSMNDPFGSVFRYYRVEGAQDLLFVSRIDVPAVGATVDMARPTDVSNESHRAALRAQLAEIGLTSGEAGAFERAWFTELFGSGEVIEAVGALMGDQIREGGRGADTPKAFSDAVLFFLPQDAIDGFARLEANPPPTEMVRAMAVRAGWRRN